MSKRLVIIQGLLWESDAHFTQEMNCDDRSPYSCLIVIVLSLALRQMMWPGCTSEGNPPKQAGCPQFTYRIQSLICPEPFALPRCWQKAVAETHVRISVCMWMIRCWSLWRCPGLVQFTSITVISGWEILVFYSSPVHDQWYPEAALLCCALPG